MEVISVGIDDLMADPTQPRKTFLREEIERLAASIKACGVQSPLRVQRDEQRQVYQILTGESRWRAARIAGLTELPCIVIEGQLSEIDKLADRLTENSIRHDLEPIEEAQAMAKLKALMGCTSKTLVERFGFTGASITRMESLLRLSPEVQAMVGTGPGKVAPSIAYEISRLGDPQAEFILAREVVDRRLSREAVTEKVRAAVGSKNVKPKDSRLALRLDGGLSVTVTAGQPLTWEDLLAALDRIRKEARKLCDGGKEVAALARALTT